MPEYLSPGVYIQEITPAGPIAGAGTSTAAFIGTAASAVKADLGVPVLVVNFLAVLELVRESLIEVTQSESFAPIYVKLAHARPE